MTKFLWPRRICSSFLCCGGSCCPHLHHQKQSNSKNKRDHYHHHYGYHRNGGHIWRKTVVFGIFVFTLYFALLSFVSFLAVSNHGRMVISSPSGSRSGSGGSAVSHIHMKVSYTFIPRKKLKTINHDIFVCMKENVPPN